MKRPVSRPLAAAFIAAGVLTVITGRASAPAGRYTISSGTVYDTKTKLTWQQAASSSSFTQANALAYCAPPWRLPTLKELVTIVDHSTAVPSIDATAFPNTPADSFWTSTPYVGSSGYAWTVDFGDGYTGGSDGASNTFYARCVR